MKRQGWMLRRLRDLALVEPMERLLRALIDAVHELDEINDYLSDYEVRLRALEAKARDYQEDGELAARHARITIENRLGPCAARGRTEARPGEMIHTSISPDGTVWRYSRFANPMGRDHEEGTHE